MDLTPLIKRNHHLITRKHTDAMEELSKKPSMMSGQKPENTLVVIRHGSTSLNNESDERIRGWLDVPLSPEGEKEVSDNVPALKKAKIDGLICSDLSRTRQTAEIISKETGIPILGESSALRPWHLGNMTGQPVKNVIETMMSYINDKPNVPVPGGESFNQFKERFIRFVQQVQTQYPHDKIAIVTHHRGERLMTGWMRAGKPDDVLKVDSDVFNYKGTPPGSHKDFEVPPPADDPNDRYK